MLKNSINKEILKYFLLFSILILVILWLFQFIFFKSFYKEQKIADTKAVSTKLKEYQDKDNFKELINDLAFDNSVCIEITNAEFNTIYSSTYFGKGCISNMETSYKYKNDFLNSKENEKSYEIINKDFQNKTIVSAVKLNDNAYAFVNTSIEPIDGITNLIRKQLIVISALVLILSYILAYFISKHISRPIKEVSSQAKELAKGNFDIEFPKDSRILEIEELSSTLNYAKEELNRTEEFRRDLMANVSHDLKTPLTMIKANAEIAKDLHSDVKKKREEDLDTIISETDRLTILVNDILALSRMESIKDDLELDEFDLIELIDNILGRYKVLQETEKYIFKFVHKDKKLMIKASKKKLEQVIYNLINNAINYTGDDNLVTVKVTSNKDNILVEIIDTGKGINEEDIPYIWDKYYKNKKKHKRNLIGTGLGLNIVKNILEQHKFKYGVKSSNKGTTFYFEIKKKIN